MKTKKIKNDYSEFKNYLNTEMKDVQFQKRNMKRIILFFSLIFILLLALFSVLIVTNLYMINPKTNNKIDLNFHIISVVCTFLIVPLIVKLYFALKKPNDAAQHIPKNVYQKFYELVHKNEHQKLKFNGLTTQIIKNQEYYGFSFTTNDCEINWINYGGKNKETWRRDDINNAKVINYSLTVNNPKLKKYDEINIFINRKNKKDFISESLEFNKKIRVVGKNQQQITKLFSPKVIDSFNHSDLKNFYGYKINVNDSLISLKGKEAAPKNNLYEAVNINYFKQKKLNGKKYIKTITKEIELDFERFFKVWTIIEPLVA